MQRGCLKSSVYGSPSQPLQRNGGSEQRGVWRRQGKVCTPHCIQRQWTVQLETESRAKLPRTPHEDIWILPTGSRWAPLVAQMVKNLPAKWETWVWSEKGMATRSRILAFHGQRSLAGYSPWGRKESDTVEWLKRTIDNREPQKILSNLPDQVWF